MSTRWTPADVSAILSKQAKGQKKSKYGNVKTVVDGYRFDSKREAARWSELCLMQKAGLISALAMQPSFDLRVQDQTGFSVSVGRYRADFSYIDAQTRQTVVEDVKSKASRTEAYMLRKRIVEAQYGISIVEVT